MGVTVELEGEDLCCKSGEDAKRAADIINGNDWISPYHLRVSPWTPCDPQHQAGLTIDHFAGDHWQDDLARRVWLAIAPHMADGATIEFQGESSERWRIRWEEGRVFEDQATAVVWAFTEEITAPEEKAS